MNRGASLRGDVGGMLRSRKPLALLALLALIGCTILLIRSREGFTASLFHGGAAQKQELPTEPVASFSHPITALIAQAESEFRAVRARQSQTLEDAVAEYRRRYKLPPPPHFDKWYNFAKRRGVELIDEYDTIYHSLLPFWALEAAVIRERTREAIGFDNALIAVLIRGGKITKIEGGGEMYAWQREATPLMLKDFIKWLPDMDLAFNVHDESRVVMPHDDLARHVTIATDESIPRALNNPTLKKSFSSPPSDLGDGIRIKEYKTTRFNRFAHQPTWVPSRLSCPLDSAARGCLKSSCPDDTAAYSGQPLNFIRNHTSYTDICHSPSMERTFGFFDRPNAFDVVHELYPIFSQSKISSFQDILYPSPWYFAGRVQYDSSRDMPWEAKVSNMYWRGSTTGGFSRDGGWRRQHRQRFLQAIQPLNNATILTHSNEQDSLWHEQAVPMAEMEHFFDIHFTHIGQCDPGDCDAQREYFGTVEPVNMFDAFGSKYLLDIDGNAFSGRYYAWLQSKSLVFKLAVFREWHDEIVKEWVHYVPLGLSGREVVESVRYLDQEEMGRQQAQRMAGQGREWADEALRREDMVVWFFRLLLEFGRVLDDDRENIGFTL